MSVLAAVHSKKSMWALHLAGNAALMAAVYRWLWIPDQTSGDVALTAVTGLAIVGAALWLHGATLAYFRLAHASAGAGMGRAFRTALRNLPAFGVWMAIVVAGGWLILELMTYESAVSNWIASWMTLRLRRPVSPSTIAWIYAWVVWLAAFIKWPLLLLPWGASAANKGFAAFRADNLRSSARIALRPRYWLQCVGLFLIGFLIPYLLVNWTPKVTGIPAETTSMVIRFLVAYIVAVTAWLVTVDRLPEA